MISQYLRITISPYGVVGKTLKELQVPYNVYHKEHNMRNSMVKALVALCVIFGFNISLASAMADTPPVPGAIPATQVTSTSSSSSESSSIEEGSVEFVKAEEEFEKKTGKKAVYFWDTKGVSKKTSKASRALKKKRSSSSCVNPISMGWIKAGEKFRNTWLGNVIGWWKWQRGWAICNWRVVYTAEFGWVVKGTKKNCQNKDIMIVLGKVGKQKIKRKKIAKVKEFVSKKSFIAFYLKWKNVNINKETITHTDTKYTCPPGYMLNGTWCIPPTTTPTAPKCTGLSLSYNSATRTVSATVTYLTDGTTFKDVTFDWQDGTPTTTTSNSASHTYPNVTKSYTVAATVRFNDGTVSNEAICKKPISVTIVCPPGNTPNETGTMCVKDGSSQPTPPPTTAPGPNPAPSPGSPSAQCYWENAGPNPDGQGTHGSGDPVDPKYIHNGACPAGSTDFS